MLLLLATFGIGLRCFSDFGKGLYESKTSGQSISRCLFLFLSVPPLACDSHVSQIPSFNQGGRSSPMNLERSPKPLVIHCSHDCRSSNGQGYPNSFSTLISTMSGAVSRLTCKGISASPPSCDGPSMDVVIVKWKQRPVYLLITLWNYIYALTYINSFCHDDDATLHVIRDWARDLRIAHACGRHCSSYGLQQSHVVIFR